MTGVLLRLNIAIKVTLVALLLHAVVFSDLPQCDGKGIGTRLALYPVSIWFVPFVWWLALRRRGRELRYPHLIDICVAMITIGFGAVTHVVWEVLEYLAFIRNNPNELAGAYTDTIGDLVMSLSGSITGTVLVGTVLFGVGRLRPSPPPH